MSNTASASTHSHQPGDDNHAGRVERFVEGLLNVSYFGKDNIDGLISSLKEKAIPNGNFEIVVDPQHMDEIETLAVAAFGAEHVISPPDKPNSLQITDVTTGSESYYEQVITALRLKKRKLEPDASALQAVSGEAKNLSTEQMIAFMPFTLEILHASGLTPSGFSKKFDDVVNERSVVPEIPLPEGPYVRGLRQAIDDYDHKHPDKPMPVKLVGASLQKPAMLTITDYTIVNTLKSVASNMGDGAYARRPLPLDHLKAALTSPVAVAFLRSAQEPDTDVKYHYKQPKPSAGNSITSNDAVAAGANATEDFSTGEDEIAKIDIGVKKELPQKYRNMQNAIKEILERVREIQTWPDRLAPAPVVAGIQPAKESPMLSGLLFYGNELRKELIEERKRLSAEYGPGKEEHAAYEFIDAPKFLKWMDQAITALTEENIRQELGMPDPKSRRAALPVIR